MIGRVLAPPAPPFLVPGAATRVKHVATHDVGTDTLGQAGDHVGVDGVLTAGLALLLPPAGGLEDPLVEAETAFADGVREALVGASDEAVERDRDLTGDVAHAGMTSSEPQNHRIATPRAWARTYTCCR